ncbi:MAG: lasso peptide biosynthesis B2 protein [Thermomicrobiales bacterium]
MLPINGQTSGTPIRQTSAAGTTGEASATLRIEALGWSALVRVLLATLALERTLRVLNAIPRRKRRSATASMPPEAAFRLAGACLGRSLARGQYLRVRGYPSVLVIGGLGSVDAFHAHAWLDGDDPGDADFIELRRIAR